MEGRGEPRSYVLYSFQIKTPSQPRRLPWGPTRIAFALSL